MTLKNEKLRQGQGQMQVQMEVEEFDVVLVVASESGWKEDTNLDQRQHMIAII